METPRISQVLPTIKCSNCGITVELRRLVDHICEEAPSMPEMPNQYRKPLKQDPRLNTSRQNDNQRPNLSPLSVSDNNQSTRSNRSPRSPRPFYDAPLSSDSGYSSNTNNYVPQKQNNPNNYAPLQPSTPTSSTFLNKYAAAKGKTSPSSTPRTNSNSSNNSNKSSISPTENNGYYNNNYPNGNTYNQDPYNAQKPRDPPYAQVYDNDNNYQMQTPKQFDAYDNRQNSNNNNNRYPSTTSSSSSNSNDNYDGRDYPRTANELRIRDRSPGNYDRGNNGYDPRNNAPENPNRYQQPNNNNNNNNNNHKTNGSSVSSASSASSGVDKLLNELMSEMVDNTNNTNICAFCDSKINSSPMWALGRAWHPHHLLCTSCQRPIDPNEGHVEKNGKVYCPRDYAENFLPKCRRCGLSVEKEAVSASDGKLEGKWHVECFNCHSCYKPFPDKSFYVFNNAPYCKRHYHRLNNSLCRQCDDPIEGPCAQTVEGWRYHPRCFVCINCAIPLTDIYYSFENQQYCETHILEIQRRRKIRAEKRMTMFRNI